MCYYQEFHTIVDHKVGKQCEFLVYYLVKTQIVDRKVDRAVIDEVREKVRRLKVSSGRSIRTALVYAGELSEGVLADGYFDFIVPAEKLFLN